MGERQPDGGVKAGNHGGNPDCATQEMAIGVGRPECVMPLGAKHERQDREKAEDAAKKAI
jgi:hypothetical protein